MNTREVLNSLISQSFTPFTVAGLMREINDTKLDTTSMEVHILFTLNRLRDQLIKAINLELLNTIIITIKQSLLNRMDIEALKLSSDPSRAEMVEFLRVIHQEAQRIQSQKEEIMHFISFFNSAKGYLSSFHSAVSLILKEYLSSGKDDKYSKDAMLNDILVFKEYLTNQMRDLNHILDEVLSPRSNLCLKLESSARLLSNYQNPENRMHLQG